MRGNPLKNLIDYFQAATMGPLPKDMVIVPMEHIRKMHQWPINPDKEDMRFDTQQGWFYMASKIELFPAPKDYKIIRNNFAAHIRDIAFRMPERLSERKAFIEVPKELWTDLQKTQWIIREMTALYSREAMADADKTTENLLKRIKPATVLNNFDNALGWLFLRCERTPRTHIKTIYNQGNPTPV